VLVITSLLLPTYLTVLQHGLLRGLFGVWCIHILANGYSVDLFTFKHWYVCGNCYILF